MTLLTDLSDPTRPQILAVARGKDTAAARKCLDLLSEGQRQQVRTHRVDMGSAYPAACAVRLNVDLDAALTVIANGCYRWLASRLRGFEKAAPKQLYRRFVETGGTVQIQGDGITVTFERRSDFGA